MGSQRRIDESSNIYFSAPIVISISKSWRHWLFGLEQGQLPDPISRVNPGLKGYLEESQKGEQEGCAKEKDGPPLHTGLQAQHPNS